MAVDVAYAPKAFVSDGSLSPRTLEWPIRSASHLIVTVDNATRTLGQHFDITGSYPSQQIVPLPGFADAGQTVRYRRATPARQDYSITGPSLSREALEGALDRQSMVSQEQAEALSRSLSVPPGQAPFPLGDIAPGEVMGNVGGVLKGVKNDPVDAADSAARAEEAAGLTASDRAAVAADKAAALLARLQAEGFAEDAEQIVANVSAALVAGTVSDLVGTRIYIGRAALEADLAHAAGLYALTVGDPVAANNDLYRKTGASGTGSWGEPLGFFAAASAEANAAAAVATAQATSILGTRQSVGQLASTLRLTIPGGVGNAAEPLIEDGKTVGMLFPAGEDCSGAGVQLDYLLTPAERAGLPGSSIRILAVFEASADFVAENSFFGAGMQVQVADNSHINGGSRTRFEQDGNLVFVEATYTVADGVKGFGASIILDPADPPTVAEHYLKPLWQTYRVEAAPGTDGTARTPGDMTLDERLKKEPGARYLIERDADGFSVVDRDRQRLLHIDLDGRTMFDPSDRLLELVSSRLSSDTVPAQYGNIIAPVILLHFYGQSLSLGAGTEQLLSGTSPYPNVLMPDQGVQDALWSGGNLTGTESLATSLVPLDPSVRSQNIEAPVIGAANQIASRMKYADLICANAGRGGVGIQGLEKGYNGGNGPYALLVDQPATYAGLTDGRPLKSIVFWMQGESDANIVPTTPANSRLNYKIAFFGIKSDYEADTAQDAVHFVTYQLSSHTFREHGYNYNIGLALGEAGEESDDVSVALPMYFLDYQPAPDGVHLTAASSRLAGAFMGKAAHHYLLSGTKFRPLSPISVTRVGKIITAKFHVPVGNLVVDTDTVSDPGDLGFEVLLQSNDAVQPVQRIDVYGDEIRIVLESLPSGPIDLGYALGTTLNGQPAGRFTGARGCIRDEDQTRAYWDSGVKLHNRLVMFRKGEGYGA